MDASRQNAFMLGSPPLAALHTMAEMKQTLMQYPCSMSQPAKTVNYPSYSAATPHGINDILGRSVVAANSSQLQLPHLNLSPAGMYFSAGAAARFATKPMPDLSNRPHLYWPGLPVQPSGNPWRTDRLPSCSPGKKTYLCFWGS